MKGLMRVFPFIQGTWISSVLCTSSEVPGFGISCCIYMNFKYAHTQKYIHINTYAEKLILNSSFTFPLLSLSLSLFISHPTSVPLSVLSLSFIPHSLSSSSFLIRSLSSFSFFYLSLCPSFSLSLSLSLSLSPLIFLSIISFS